MKRLNNNSIAWMILGVLASVVMFAIKYDRINEERAEKNREDLFGGKK